MQTSYRVLFRLNVLTFFLLNAFPSEFLFLASLGTCLYHNTKHLEGASPSLAESLWRCNTSGPGRESASLLSVQRPDSVSNALWACIYSAILDGRWNRESFIDYLNWTSLLSGPLSFLEEKANVRGSLCKVRAMSACLSVHREGKKLPNTHICDLSPVSNKPNLKDEFFSQFPDNIQENGRY